MRRAIPTPAGGSEFDEFLYAPIAEENNGMLLSMLSALARLNLDPWDEAARLARLPRATATRFLVTLIAALPEGPSARTDPGALAQRLVALLPPMVARTGQSRDPAPLTGNTANRHSRNTAVILYLLFALCFFGAQWLNGHAHTAAPPATGATPSVSPALPQAAVPASAPAAVSPPG